MPVEVLNLTLTLTLTLTRTLTLTLTLTLTNPNPSPNPNQVPESPRVDQLVTPGGRYAKQSSEGRPR